MDQQFYDLPIAGLAFQEEIMDDAEHRFSYRYKRRVQIKVHISMTDNGISLMIKCNKENKKIKKLLTTVETHLVEKIREHPRYRMYLVTGNKSIDTDIDYNVEENVYLSFADYHYGLWGQWLSVFIMMGVGFWNIGIEIWLAYILLGYLSFYIYRCMKKWYTNMGGDPKTVDSIKMRIGISIGCLMAHGVAGILIFAFP